MSASQLFTHAEAKAPPAGCALACCAEHAHAVSAVGRKFHCARLPCSYGVEGVFTNGE